MLQRTICSILSFILCLPMLALGQGNMGVKELQCPKSNIFGSGMFTDVCWSAVFPIRIAGKISMTSGYVPPDAATKSFCACRSTSSGTPSYGITVGLWQPTRIIEAVRKPYCFPTLNADLSGTSSYSSNKQQGGGGRGVTSHAKNNAFYHVHAITFPALALARVMNVASCNVEGFEDVAVQHLSEVYPNWHKPELSSFINPETMLFTNPVAMAAQPLDCTTVSAGNYITGGANATTAALTDNLFWVAGCWGNLYPFNGFDTQGSSVSTSSLLTTRMMAMIARIGLASRTIGNDTICKHQPMLTLKKSQYKVQMVFPVPESRSNRKPNTKNNAAAQNVIDPSGNSQSHVPEIDPSEFLGSTRSCTHSIGQSTMTWGEWRSRPATGEDFIYLMWQWTDCCVGLFGT